MGSKPFGYGFLQASDGACRRIFKKFRSIRGFSRAKRSKGNGHPSGHEQGPACRSSEGKESCADEIAHQQIAAEQDKTCDQDKAGGV
jgi:hypothetical protein